MKGPWQKFEVSEGMLEAIERKVAAKEEIFPLCADPLLASLVSCLGLQFELGKRDQDRTSFLLGVDLAKEKQNPWQSEIISLGDQLGLRAWIPGRRELRPLHEDFRLVLHPLSLSREGLLNQIVIFPQLVAESYRARGLELVVVKDWAQSAFLSRKRNLNYQKTNLDEIEANVARTQIKLMRNRQLAFTGTHDLADHLLGGHASGIAGADALLEEIEPVYERAFSASPQKNSSLVISYLVAVLLDDLAQPQWYSSSPHLWLAREALSLLERTRNQPDLAAIRLPQSFHSLVAEARNRSYSQPKLEAEFRRFSLALSLGLSA